MNNEIQQQKTNQTNSGSSEHVLIPASHVRVYMCSRDDHG